MSGHAQLMRLFALDAALHNSNNDPMPEDEALALLYQHKTHLDHLKMGKASRLNVLELTEFFLVLAGAVELTAARTVKDGLPALNSHLKILDTATTTAMSIYRRFGDDDVCVATGNQLRNLDDGYQAAVGALDALPQWAIKRAGFLQLKAKSGELFRSKPKTKRKKRPSKRR